MPRSVRLDLAMEWILAAAPSLVLYRKDTSLLALPSQKHTTSRQGTIMSMSADLRTRQLPWLQPPTAPTPTVSSHEAKKLDARKHLHHS